MAKVVTGPVALLIRLNGLFQAAKRRARGYQRLSTIRTVVFLLAGKLDFRKRTHTQVNPLIQQSART